MRLAEMRIVPPKEWIHNPNMIEPINKMTVAMHFALNGIIPPECWIHKSNL